MPSSKIATDSAAPRIVAAARAHFLSHGFRAVTMDDLAAEMGMRKKTLYQHFETKRDLVREVILQKSSEFGAAMDAIRSDEFSETLQQMLGCLHQNLSEVSPSFIRDLGKAHPDYFKLIQERRHQVIGRSFGRVFRMGQASGAIRSDVSAELMIAMLLGAVDAVLDPKSMAKGDLRPDALLESVLKVFLDGVRISGVKS